MSGSEIRPSLTDLELRAMRECTDGNVIMSHPLDQTDQTNPKDKIGLGENMETGGFITKDSGKREQFESGMVRDTQEGKLRFDLAFDGPLFWTLFDGRPCGLLVRAAEKWYNEGGLINAAEVIWQMSEYEGKDIFDLVERYAALMMRGAIKYSEKNWMKAEGDAEFKRFKSSFCRHFKQYIKGELDEDHGAAVFFNLNGAEYVSHKLTV
jgi:hypothetical protein